MMNNNYIETLYDYDTTTVDIFTCSFTYEEIPVEFELTQSSQIPQVSLIKNEEIEMQFNPTISFTEPFSFQLKVNLNSCSENFILQIVNKLTSEVVAVYNFNYTENN